MSHMQVTPTFGQSATVGSIPGEWVGVDLPDGDRTPWLEAPVGSVYVYKTSETAATRRFVKRQNNARDDDWSAMAGSHVLQQYFTFSQFTDGGGAAGTLALTETIPAGAWVQQAVLVNLTGFSGNVSATIIVGDGSDTDRYNTGTPDVFTTAAALDLGVPSGVKIHTTAATVTVTITSSTDWGLVTAGSATIRIYYLN